jgi:ferritin-like metal-binding protein YciE
MKINEFKDLFNMLLADIHCIEECSTRLLPILIQKAKSNDLKEALQNHLQETREQQQRTHQICEKSGVSMEHVEWESPLKIIFDNAEKFVNENETSALLDAAIIAIVQKIEHIEIADYGTLAEYSKVFEQPEVKELCLKSLKEEKKTDTLLTKLAKGGFFESGINVEATKSR